MARGHVLSRLDAYLEGALPPRLRRRVEGHLERCPRCRAVVAERAQVLSAARSVDARPAAEGPVMRERGVPGRLVAGVLTGLVLLAAVVAAVWVAGAPRSTVSTTAHDPVRALSTVEGADTDRGALAAVTRLRSEGWTVPSLLAAGLEPLTVDARRRGDGVEVIVAWGHSEPAVTVRECRAPQGGRTLQECGEELPASMAGTTAAPAPDVLPASALASAAAPAGSAASAVGAASTGTVRLPGRLAPGAEYRIVDLPDGEWEAELALSDVVYRVRAGLPRAQAEALLTQLMVADRSGLTELHHEDDPADRLERGLSRLREAVPTGARTGGEAVLAAR